MSSFVSSWREDRLHAKKGRNLQTVQSKYYISIIKVRFAFLIPEMSAGKGSRVSVHFGKTLASSEASFEIWDGFVWAWNNLFVHRYL